MDIGNVARIAGVNSSRIRYYEKIGVLPVPPRVNGRRRYDDRVLKLLEMIQLAKRAGFSLAEVRTLLYGFSDEVSPSERWRILARTKLPEVEALVEHALVMKRLLERGTHCECLRLADCDLLPG